MKADIFTDIPNELKTIEIDAEKNIFKINGVDFGDGTEAVFISKVGGEGFKVSVDIRTRVMYANYDVYGKKTDDRIYEKVT